MSADVSDEVLYALTPDQRAVVRRMAEGGWQTGKPGRTAVVSACKALGLGLSAWESEHVRGEPTAFWPGLGYSVMWTALAARLDALPRRKPGTVPSRPKKPRTRWATLDPDCDRDVTVAEDRAIAALQAVAARWPSTLRLVSMDGSLYVIHTDDERFHSDDNVLRNQTVIATVPGIPNEGGGW